MGDFLVFDLETQYSAQEVGGWNYIDQMKMSLGVVWDSRKQAFTTYLEDKVMELIDHLKSGPVVIGYNHIGFDYRVLSGYYPAAEKETEFQALCALDNFDLLLDIKERLGFRLKLDSLVTATLGVGKSADGLQALEWYKEGKIDLIEEYCRQDVAVTRDLYLYGLEHKEVSYNSGKEGIKTVSVDWASLDDPPFEAEQLSF